MTGQSRALALISIALGVVVLLGVNILSNLTLTSARFDLTESRIYTLSEGSRNILENLAEPVTLRFFASRRALDRIPGFGSYAARVEELLMEYARRSGGTIDLVIIDPEPFSEEEDRALGYGLQGIPLDGQEERLYFGLVGTGPTDEEEVIPFFALEREALLEYDLTRLVYRLAHPETPTVGLVTSLPMGGAAPGMPGVGPTATEPWVVLEQIRELFEVESLGNEFDVVPERVDVLMVVHPRGLSSTTLYAIDQYLLGGGRALMFLDPYAEADSSAQIPGMAGTSTSDLSPLLEAWGLSLDRETVVADLVNAAQVRTMLDGRQIVVDYPVWMNIQPVQFSADDVLTADLGNLMFATAGAFQVEAKENLSVEPLVTSTKDVAKIPVTLLAPGADPREIVRQYEPLGETQPLMVRVTGSANSAYSERPLVEKEAGQEQADAGPADAAVSADRPHLTGGEVNLVLVSDTDFLTDRFWVSAQNLLGTRLLIPNASNGAFVVGALENLTGDNDLISVRNRGALSRPFSLIQGIRRDAELQFRRKELELIGRLEAAEQKLLELEGQKGERESLTLSDAQAEEIERFRAERLRLRTELREVRRDLREDIERVEAFTRFVNIALVPLLVALVGIVAGWQRLRRRDQPPATGVTTS